LNPIIDKILLRVKAVAPVAVDHVVPGEGRLVERLMREVAEVDPDTPLETAAEAIAGNHGLAALLLVRAMRYEVRIVRGGLEAM